MTEILSIFVSYPANVASLLVFLTYIVSSIRSIILTKMLLKHGKKHATVTKNRLEF